MISLWWELHLELFHSTYIWNEFWECILKRPCSLYYISIYIYIHILWYAKILYTPQFNKICVSTRHFLWYAYIQYSKRGLDHSNINSPPDSALCISLALVDGSVERKQGETFEDGGSKGKMLPCPYNPHK